MRLYEVIWKEAFVDKLERKHRVMPEEVEDVLFSKPHIRRAEKGHVQGKTCMSPMAKPQPEDTSLSSSFSSIRLRRCLFPLAR